MTRTNIHTMAAAAAAAVVLNRDHRAMGVCEVQQRKKLGNIYCNVDHGDTHERLPNHHYSLHRHAKGHAEGILRMRITLFSHTNCSNMLQLDKL